MPAEWDLSRLLAPVSEREFLDRYWDCRRLIVRRNDVDYYSSLLTIEDLDEILSTTGLRPPTVRLVKNGAELPISRLVSRSLLSASPNLDLLYREFQAGATIGLNFLHEQSGRLADLCRTLGEAFSSVAQVNAYITPPNCTGLKPHYDTHDVFVLQIRGCKHWRFYSGGPVRPLPIEDRDDSSDYKVEEEVTLQPGDLLYLPRGVVHAAASLEALSAHLTVGVSPMTWAHLILREVERIVLDHPQFRVALPASFARSGAEDVENRLRYQFAALVERVDPDSIIRDTQRQADAALRDELRSHLIDIDLLSELQPATLCRLRTGSRIKFGPEGVVILRNGKEVQLPLSAAEAVLYVQQSPGFMVRDLPGLEDDDSRMIFARRLIEEGILTMQLANGDSAVRHRSAAPLRR